MPARGFTLLGIIRVEGGRSQVCRLRHILRCEVRIHLKQLLSLLLVDAIGSRRQRTHVLSLVVAFAVPLIFKFLY